MTDDQIKEHVLYSTIDPTVVFPTDKGPGDMPALTTMLHRVCDNDHAKFEEAVRLVDLFIKKTIEVYAADMMK